MKPLFRQDIILYDNIKGIETAKDIALSRNSDLEFELKVVSIDDAPEYTALSYVWVTLEATKPIIVDGQDFLITENLDFCPSACTICRFKSSYFG